MLQDSPEALAPHCSTTANDNPQHSGLQTAMLPDMLAVLVWGGVQLPGYLEVFCGPGVSCPVNVIGSRPVTSVKTCPSSGFSYTMLNTCFYHVSFTLCCYSLKYPYSFSYFGIPDEMFVSVLLLWISKCVLQARHSAVGIAVKESETVCCTDSAHLCVYRLLQICPHCRTVFQSSNQVAGTLVGSLQ